MNESESVSRLGVCLILWNPRDYIACQAPLSMEFSRQEDWSGLPFPSPGDLPDSGIEPRSAALQADSLPFDPPGKPPKNMNKSPQSLRTPYHHQSSHSCQTEAGGRGRWNPTGWAWKAGSQSVSTGPQWNKPHPPPALHPQSSPVFFTLSFQWTSSQNFPTPAANRTPICILRFCLIPIWLTLCGPSLAKTKYTCNFQKWAEPRKPNGDVNGEVLLLPEYGISQL